jgi:hypothetical protein
MGENDPNHVGKEENFWPLAENLARVYKVALSKGLTSAQFAAILELSRAKSWERKTRPELSTSSTDGISPELGELTIDENSLPPFEYKPLDDAKAIRVLILHPGKPSEPLRGTIRHQLFSRVSYEAISYTWGGDSTPRFMILDGKRMPLTQSLYDALVRLRRKKHGRILWADGVCINQEDSKEKSVQVGLMPEIFKQARVLVYLGREAFQSEEIPYLLEKLRNFDRKSEKSSSQKLSPEEFLKSNGLPPQYHMSWIALIPFLFRSWFMRMWVVQEIVLAREIRFFCGDWELGWRELSAMANGVGKVLRKALPNISDEVFTVCDQAAASLGLMLGVRSTRSLVTARFEEILKGMEQKDTFASAINTVLNGEVDENIAKDREYVIQVCREHPEAYTFIEESVIGLPDEVLPSKSPMLYLLGMFTQNKATRPQDRLYALAGLSCDISLTEFRPDYDETLEQTNLRFSKLLVTKGQGMDLLYHATKWPWELENPSLPTWAADWTRHRGQFDHWLRFGWAYHGGWAKLFAAPSSVRLNDKTGAVLNVTGFQVATIASVVKFVPMNLAESPDDQDAVSKISRFFSTVTEIFAGEPYFSGESWEEIACRTLMTDHIPKEFESAPISKILELYQEFIQHASDLDKTKEKGGNIWAGKVITTMIGNSVFKAENGYVGVAPETIAPGDEIYMFERANLPFALRPSKIKPGYHQFLGGCYVHGLMAGKAWDLEHTLSEVSLI